MLHQRLTELYSRRSTVEALIRYLETYADCQAKHEGQDRVKNH